MTQHVTRVFLSLAAALVLATACGGGGDGIGDPDPSGQLRIEPAAVILTTVDGVAARQDYTVTLVGDDGSEVDVTEEVVFNLVGDPQLGQIAGATFTATGQIGGEGSVRAVLVREELLREVSAIVRIQVENTRVIEPAPGNAADLFAGATEDPGRAPRLEYPADQTMVPPNLGEYDVHWTDLTGNDLFEVKIEAAYVTLRVFTTSPPSGPGFITVLPNEWAVLGGSSRGAPLVVTVRGLTTLDPSLVGSAPSIMTHVTESSVEGGIYYWASTSISGAPEGIYRHDMARPGQPPERFYTTMESPSGRCVACHAISRDGARMAITYDGGNGAATVLDVATQTPILAVDGSFAWNFATFEPGGERLLTVRQGALTLRTATDGAPVAVVPSPGYATHPDFSPSGDAIVYVSAAAPSADWVFTGGDIVVQSFDPVGATFGPPTVLVAAAPGANNYYPSWSPDGQWILFNRSNGDAYDDPGAEIFVVKADGSAPPVYLESPGIGAGLTNSWARWAPFAQTLEGEPLYWMTFSSKRSFGVRMAAGRPQIWMAPFFPARAVDGSDPSAPAFRLPAQDLDTNNHIAQWTETVVPIE